MRKLALALVALSLAACHKAQDEGVEEDPNASPPPFVQPEGGGGFGKGDGSPGGNVECADDAKDVYVISEERTLYSFHPPTLTFKPVGILKCPTTATPTSMAVDRFAIAWVRHNDGSVWKVNTKDMTCQGTAYTPPSSGDFFQFGMGFASATTGSSIEALYISDSNGAGLGRLDTSNLKVTPVGPYTGALAGRPCELTGTGSGKLYGFFVTAPASIAEIAKESGAISFVKELPNTYAGNAWAFSFYGGDFYVYTASDGSGGLPRNGTGSDVTRWKASAGMDGPVEVVKPKIGFRIVGAGVSTCAPTTGPN